MKNGIWLGWLEAVALLLFVGYGVSLVLVGHVVYGQEDPGTILDMIVTSPDPEEFYVSIPITGDGGAIRFEIHGRHGKCVVRLTQDGDRYALAVPTCLHIRDLTFEEAFPALPSDEKELP